MSSPPYTSYRFCKGITSPIITSIDHQINIKTPPQLPPHPKLCVHSYSHPPRPPSHQHDKNNYKTPSTTPHITITQYIRWKIRTYTTKLKYLSKFTLLSTNATFKSYASHFFPQLFFRPIGPHNPNKSTKYLHNNNNSVVYILYKNLTDFLYKVVALFVSYLPCPIRTRLYTLHQFLYKQPLYQYYSYTLYHCPLILISSLSINYILPIILEYAPFWWLSPRVLSQNLRQQRASLQQYLINPQQPPHPFLFHQEEQITAPANLIEPKSLSQALASHIPVDTNFSIMSSNLMVYAATTIWSAFTTHSLMNLRMYIDLASRNVIKHLVLHRISTQYIVPNNNSSSNFDSSTSNIISINDFYIATTQANITIPNIFRMAFTVMQNSKDLYYNYYNVFSTLHYTLLLKPVLLAIITECISLFQTYVMPPAQLNNVVNTDTFFSTVCSSIQEIKSYNLQLQQFAILDRVIENDTIASYGPKNVFSNVLGSIQNSGLLDDIAESFISHFITQHVNEHNMKLKLQQNNVIDVSSQTKNQIHYTPENSQQSSSSHIPSLKSLFTPPHQTLITPSQTPSSDQHQLLLLNTDNYIIISREIRFICNQIKRIYNDILFVLGFVLNRVEAPPIEPTYHWNDIFRYIYNEQHEYSPGHNGKGRTRPHKIYIHPNRRNSSSLDNYDTKNPSDGETLVMLRNVSTHDDISNITALTTPHDINDDLLLFSTSSLNRKTNTNNNNTNLLAQRMNSSTNLVPVKKVCFDDNVDILYTSLSNTSSETLSSPPPSPSPPHTSQPILPSPRQHHHSPEGDVILTTTITSPTTSVTTSTRNNHQTRMISFGPFHIPMSESESSSITGNSLGTNTCLDMLSDHSPPLSSQHTPNMKISTIHKHRTTIPNPASYDNFDPISNKINIISNNEVHSPENLIDCEQGGVFSDEYESSLDNINTITTHLPHINSLDHALNMHMHSFGRSTSHKSSEDDGNKSDGAKLIPATITHSLSHSRNTPTRPQSHHYAKLSHFHTPQPPTITLSHQSESSKNSPHPRFHHIHNHGTAYDGPLHHMPPSVHPILKKSSFQNLSTVTPPNPSDSTSPHIKPNHIIYTLKEDQHNISSLQYISINSIKLRHITYSYPPILPQIELASFSESTIVYNYILSWIGSFFSSNSDDAKQPHSMKKSQHSSLHAPIIQISGDIDHTLERGKLYVCCGVNTAGKSTLAQIIARFVVSSLWLYAFNSYTQDFGPTKRPTPANDELDDNGVKMCGTTQVNPTDDIDIDLDVDFYFRFTQQKPDTQKQDQQIPAFQQYFHKSLPYICIPLQHYHKHVLYLRQKPYVYNASLYDNITCFNHTYLNTKSSSKREAQAPFLSLLQCNNKVGTYLSQSLHQCVCNCYCNSAYCDSQLEKCALSLKWVLWSMFMAGLCNPSSGEVDNDVIEQQQHHQQQFNNTSAQSDEEKHQKLIPFFTKNVQKDPNDDSSPNFIQRILSRAFGLDFPATQNQNRCEHKADESDHDHDPPIYHNHIDCSCQCQCDSCIEQEIFSTYSGDDLSDDETPTKLTPSSSPKFFSKSAPPFLTTDFITSSEDTRHHGDIPDPTHTALPHSDTTASVSLDSAALWDSINQIKPIPLHELQTLSCNQLLTKISQAHPLLAYPIDPVTHQPLLPPESLLHLYITNNGGNISGGFSQSVALSRMFIRVHAQYIILDESLSMMDTIKFATIFPRIVAFSKAINATIVIISHHLHHIVKHVDKIIFMERGRIVCFDHHNNITHPLYHSLVDQ